MRKWLIGVVAVAFVAVACGSDDGDSGSGSGSGSETASNEAPVTLSGKLTNHGTGDAKDGAIDMEVDDFYFGPTFVKTTGGSKLKVELESEGDATHTFTIDSAGIDVTVKPGEKKTV